MELLDMLDAENMGSESLFWHRDLPSAYRVVSIKSKMIHFEGTLKRRDFPSVGLWDWLQKSC
jgi:hypothetical protein